MHTHEVVPSTLAVLDGRQQVTDRFEVFRLGFEPQAAAEEVDQHLLLAQSAARRDDLLQRRCQLQVRVGTAHRPSARYIPAVGRWQTQGGRVKLLAGHRQRDRLEGGDHR